MARHNDVVALLVHDPLQSDLPASASMTVTDGELADSSGSGTRKRPQEHRRKRRRSGSKDVLCVDAGTRRSRASAQRRRRHGPAASPPARRLAEPQRGAAAAMVTWERALADAQTRQADPLARPDRHSAPAGGEPWPQTWPLRIAIVLVAVLTVLAIWRFVHRYRANRYRREALSELGSNAPDDRRSAGSVGGPTLAAGAAYGVGSFSARDGRPADRNGVAGISRPQLWRGRVLARRGTTGSSAPPINATAPDRDELHALAGLVRRWIRVHHA